MLKKNSISKNIFSLGYFCLLGLLFLTPGIIAAVPIQGRAFQGAGSADARLKILAAAESFLGVPYQYAGLDRRGMDCSGLVYVSFREGLAYTVPRTTETIYAWAEKIETRDLQPGDLVFFVTVGQRVSHVGLYAGEGWFIHSASEGPRTGVMYSRLDEAYWRRTYLGAGRALPWDNEAALALASAYGPPNQASDQVGGEAGEKVSALNSGSSSGSSAKASSPAPTWADSGIYAGFGAAWTWGGFIEGSPSVFRGIAAVASLGYKWPRYRLGLEFRPEWDRALGVLRLPLTVSVGTDMFQVFAGPALTPGNPGLKLPNKERKYKGGGYWLGELGFSAAFPPLRISRGAFSIYGELAWQPYHWEDGEDFSFKPDFTANLRLSTGVRYLWRLGT